MLIIPAIDILDKKLVRLTRGDYTRVTDYGLSPLDALRSYAAAGAKRVHLIFLSAARDGFRRGEEDLLLVELLEEKEKLGIELQVGGGIRNLEEIQRLFKWRVDYVILGTAAILSVTRIGEERLRMAYQKGLKNFVLEVDLTSENLIQEIIRKQLSEKIIIGLDCKKGAVAISGWEVTVPPEPESLLTTFSELGLRQVIYTATEQDGTLSGPDTSGLKRLAQTAPEISLIASGGIGSCDDIAALNNLNLPNLEGVIVGKALYEKRIDLKEAISRFQ